MKIKLNLFIIIVVNFIGVVEEWFLFEIIGDLL